MALRPAPMDSRPPWLDDEEDQRSAPHTMVARRWLWLVVGAFVLLGLGIAVGVTLIAKRADAPIEAQAMGGEVPLIRAPGPWRQRPADPGGRAVEGQGQVIYGASDGQDPGGTIDLNAVPETAIDRPGVAPPVESVATAPADAPMASPVSTARPAVAIPRVAAPPTAAPRVAMPKVLPPPSPQVVVAPVAPIAAPTATPSTAAPVTATPAGGTALQLGAFSTEAKARAAWKTYSGRFGYLAGLTPVVSAVAKDGGTLYRLRATGAADAAAARDLCARLRVAGEACAVVN